MERAYRGLMSQKGWMSNQGKGRVVEKRRRMCVESEWND